MVRIVFYLALASLLSGTVFAQRDSLSRTVQGVTMYVGVIPAQIVQGHPKGHAESSMHQRARGEPDLRHVVVAVFDAKTNQRIENAKVFARVGQLGLSPEYKELESMQIAGSISYGNFFRMRSNTRYKIRITVTPSGSAHSIEASFDYSS